MLAPLLLWRAQLFLQSREQHRSRYGESQRPAALLGDHQLGVHRRLAMSPARVFLVQSGQRKALDAVKYEVSNASLIQKAEPEYWPSKQG